MSYTSVILALLQNSWGLIFFVFGIIFFSCYHLRIRGGLKKVIRELKVKEQSLLSDLMTTQELLAKSHLPTSFGLDEIVSVMSGGNDHVGIEAGSSEALYQESQEQIEVLKKIAIGLNRKQQGVTYHSVEMGMNPKSGSTALQVT